MGLGHWRFETRISVEVVCERVRRMGLEAVPGERAQSASEYEECEIEGAFCCRLRIDL